MMGRWMAWCYCLFILFARFSSSFLLHSKKGRTHSRQKVSDSDDDDNGSLPDSIIHSLDLVPIVQRVAMHAGTRRGQQMLLSLVNQQDDENDINKTPQPNSRRQKWESYEDATFFSNGDSQFRQRRKGPRPKLATSAAEASREYELVEQAQLCLRNTTTSQGENYPNLTYPPLYGADSSPWDTSASPDTDYDEWLYLPASLWTCEHILQAEQVLKMLAKVRHWACREINQQWVPRLSKIGLSIEMEDKLVLVEDYLNRSVEVVQLRASLASVGSTYQFRFRDDKFPALAFLRQKEAMLMKDGKKERDASLLSLREQMEEMENQITEGIAQQVLGISDVIEDGLNKVAEMDSTFAKAAFGLCLNGVVPLVGDEGVISVKSFIHPLLCNVDGFSAAAARGEIGHVVPVDLHLSSKEGQKALVISGPNGGGKTLAMKSFGLVSTMIKFGLPIPQAVGSADWIPRVDFLEDLFIHMGDGQNVLKGESTWTSMLNFCSRTLDALPDDKMRDPTSLVLLDEFGSGTDPEAGGAISQALLEAFLQKNTQVVATTHSPRLKALSFHDKRLSCATVQLEHGSGMVKEGGFNRPSFRLEYSIIGESFALGAASRCIPSLPASVLDRASKLLANEGTSGGEDDSNAEYRMALTSSLEEQTKRVQDLDSQTKTKLKEALQCRKVMIGMASSYKLHFNRLEQRVENCYKLLQASEDNNVELLGATLSELRVVKRKIQSQEEMLRSRGLKMLPFSCRLQKQDTLVAVREGTWDGTTVEVIADSGTDTSLAPNEVLVKTSSSIFSWENELRDKWADQELPTGEQGLEQSLIFQRHELAIWDYDSVFDSMEENVTAATSISDSTQRLSSVLSKLKNDTPKASASGSPQRSSETKFLSSRDRKANRRKKGKKNKK